MSELQFALLLFAGIAAGFCNTIAGGGSIFVVPLMIILGLPATAANASLRPAILAQNLLALYGFGRSGVLTRTFMKEVFPLMLWALPAALLGARLVTEKMTDDSLEKVLAVIFVVLAVLLALWRPKPLARTYKGWAILLVVGAGFYGGFIQVGVGFLMVTALLLGKRWSMAQVHAAKIAIVGVYTVLSLPVFILSGQINWLVALFLATGQAIGGYCGSRFASRVQESLLQKIYLVMMVVFAVILFVR